MSDKYYSPLLKRFVSGHYKDAKADLCTSFILRNLSGTKPNGYVGMITIPNWMFLPSFEKTRLAILSKHVVDSLIHNGRGVFGSDFGTCAFVIRSLDAPDYQGVFRRLYSKPGSVATNEELQRVFSRLVHLPSAVAH